MPIELPNLDDRRYADLVQEALERIPGQAPAWTNYNASDPGITLIELFAYLTEMLMYRLNRVTDANVRAFLKLIDGKDRGSLAGDDLSEEVRKVVAELRKPTRAVTSADFEELVLGGFEGRIARARAVPRRNFERDDLASNELDRPGHVSVVIVPTAGSVGGGMPMPTADMIQAVKDYLEPRRLLTTRVHVVGPRYLTIGVRLTLHIRPDAMEETVRQAAVDEVLRYFDPLSGGKDGSGWPFGRNVWVSEVYELLARLPGVDYIKQSVINDSTVDEIEADPGKLIKRPYTDPISGRKREALVGVRLADNELVSVSATAVAITIVDPMTAS